MSSTAVPEPRDPFAVEAPELCCDEIAAWLDDVMTVLNATSAVGPSGSVGLRRWAVDQLGPLEQVLPWLATEIHEADIGSGRFQDACWLLLRAEAVTSDLRVRLTARSSVAA